MSHRGLAHPDKSKAPLPPPVTMTCGTVAHQQLTYLTFISVREVDRCSGSYGSSLSCSLHGAHSAAFDVSFIWDIGVVGGGGSRPLSCGFRKSWVGMDGLTLCAWCAEREPSGSQVLVLTGCLGRARSLRWHLKSWFLEGLFPQWGSEAPLLSTADMSNEP